MLKKYPALLCSVVLSQQALADVSLYGKANLSLHANDYESFDKENVSLESNASRLGVKGKFALTEKISAIVKLEYEVFLDEDRSGSNGSDFKQRNSYLGVQGEWGTLLAGKHDTPTKMAQGKVDWVIVGADRIAANGDVANKIGTYALAVLAQYHGVKFMVAAPQSTIDWHCQNGEQIPIEQRPAKEVTHIGDKQIAPDGVSVSNPAFDVTPAKLITAIVTEAGVVLSPSAATMSSLHLNA